MKCSRFLFTLLAVRSLAAFGGDVPLFGQGDNDGMFYWSVPASKLQSQRPWSPAVGPPPLSIQRSVEIARGWIKKGYPDIKDFSLASVVLARADACCEDGVERWYYRIEFRPMMGGKPLYGGQFTAVLLFDGTVVEPRKEKRVLVK